MFTSPFGAHFCFVLLEASELLESAVSEAELSILSEKATAKRRREFVAGRHAARKALVDLGITDPPPVLRGGRGVPLWPEGVVGSITHSGSWAAAVVTTAEHARSVGLDLEEVGRMRRHDISRRVCHDSEIEWLEKNDAEKALRLALVFSAKESIYKVFYPLCGKYLGFKDVELSWNERGESFSATLLVDLDDEFVTGYAFEVGCAWNESHVLTWFVIPI